MVPQDDDFTTFINARPTRLANKITPLQWWSATSQRTIYPALSKLAIDVFTPFSQSAVSEGTFSSATRTIPWERATLGGKVVEETECCHDWQVSGLAYDDSYAAEDSSDNDDDDDSTQTQSIRSQSVVSSA